MLKKTVLRILAVAAVFVTMFSLSFSAFAVSESECFNVVKQASALIGKEAVISKAGSEPFEKMVIAMAVSGEDVSGAVGHINNAIDSLLQKKDYSLYELERMGIALMAANGDVSSAGGGRNINITSRIMSDSRLLNSDIKSKIFALIYFEATGDTSQTISSIKEKLINSLINSRIVEKAAFSYDNKNPDPEITSMAITALAPYYKKNRDVAYVIEQAILYLSGAQNKNGTFSSGGTESCEATANAVIALNSLGIDTKNDSRLIKDNDLFSALMLFRNQNGSFSHAAKKAEDNYATAQAMCAAASYGKILGKTGTLYSFKIKTTPEYSQYSYEPGSSNSATASITSSKQQDEAENSAENQSVIHNSSTEENVSQGKESSNTVAQDRSGSERSALKTVATVIMALASVALCVAAYLTDKRILPLKQQFKQIAIISAIVLLTLALLLNVLKFESVSSHNKTSSVVSSTGTVAVEVSCKVLNTNKDSVPENLKDVLPEDGKILPKTNIEISSGDTAFSVLERACKQNNIVLDTEQNGNSVYVRGINYLSALDCGEKSGWIYFVNEVSASVGSSEYRLKNNDYVRFEYVIE